MADEAGLSFELFASQVAKVAEVTRQDGSQIGNTLKTTMARISRSSSADPNVTAKDRSKAAEAYKSVAGIDLYDAKGNFKDLSVVLDELSSKWGTLTDAQKNYISEQSAGVRGLNTFKVMMENYRDIQQLAKEATEDSTFYQDVQSKWENSVEGKKAGLTAQKQQLWDNMISSGTIGGAYDLASVGVSMANGFITTLKTGLDSISGLMLPNGSFKNGISTLATAGITGGLGVGVYDFMKGLPEASRSGKAGAYTQLFKDSFRPFVSTAQELGTWGKTGFDSLRQFISSLRDASKQTGSFGKTIKDAWGSTDLKKAWDNAKDYGQQLYGLKGAELEAKKAQIANQAPQSMAGKATAWMYQHPVAGGSIVGLAAVGTIVSLVASAVAKTEENRQAKIEKAQTAQQEYNKASQSVGQFRKYIEGNLEEYKQLSRGVNKATNENVSLSDAQYQKYLDFVNQVAQMAPETFSRYDKNGNAILSNRDADQIVTALKEQEMQVSQQAIDNMKDYAGAWDAGNNKQGGFLGAFDWSDNAIGTISDRIKLLQVATEEDTKSLKLLMNNDPDATYDQHYGKAIKEKVGSESLTQDPMILKRFLEDAAQMDLNQLTDENRMAFNRNLIAAVNQLKAEQESYVAPFRDSMVEILNQAKVEEASKYPYQTQKDWDNLTSLLSGISSDRLIDMLTEDPTGGLVEKYTTDWIDAMRIGGREFSDALDSVLSLSADSSVKEMEKALDETLPVLTKNLSKDAADGLEESLNLQDYRKVVDQYNRIKSGLFNGALDPDNQRRVSTKSNFDTKQIDALAKDYLQVQKKNREIEYAQSDEGIRKAKEAARQLRLQQEEQKRQDQLNGIQSASQIRQNQKEAAEKSKIAKKEASEQGKIDALRKRTTAPESYEKTPTVLSKEEQQKIQKIRDDALRKRTTASDSYDKGVLSKQQEKSLSSLLSKMTREFDLTAKQRAYQEKASQEARNQALRERSIAPESRERETLTDAQKQAIDRSRIQARRSATIAPDSYDRTPLTKQQEEALSQVLQKMGRQMANPFIKTLDQQRKINRNKASDSPDGLLGLTDFGTVNDVLSKKASKKSQTQAGVLDPRTVKAIQARSMSDLVEERGKTNNEAILDTIVSELKDGVRYTIDSSKYLADTKKNTALTAKQQDQVIRSFDDFVDRNNINSLEEFGELGSILSKLVPDNPANLDWDRVQAQWDISAINLSRFQSQLDALRANVNTFGDNLDTIDASRKQSVGTSGMDDKQIGEMKSLFGNLQGFDYDKLFESTALGIHMNATELERLTGLYRDGEMKKYETQIKDMTRAWQELCEEINNTQEGTARYNNLIGQRDNLAKQIQEAREVQSMFEGLNNPVSQYMRALSGPEEGDTYDLLAGDKGYKEAKSLYDKGLVGTEKFKKFAQMLTNEDLSGKGIDKYVEAYEARAANFAAIFNEDGIEGVQNALNLLRKDGLVKESADGGEHLDGSVRDFAESLKVSDAAASVFMKKLSDFGIDISFAEETDNMKSLRHEAEAATDALTETGKSFGVGADKTDVLEVEKELQKVKKAKEEINKVDYEGKQQDLERLDAVEKYYNTLQGSRAVAINDTRTPEGQKVAQDKLDKFNEKAGTTISIDWSTDRVDDIDAAISRVKSAIDSLSGDKATLQVDAQGYEEARALIERLVQQKQLLEQPAILQVDPGVTENDASKNIIDNYKDLAQGVQKVRELEALQENGVELKENEMSQAVDDLKQSWSDFKSSKEYQGLFTSETPKGQTEAKDRLKAFGLDGINPASENFVDRIEELINGDNTVELIAEMTGDDNVKRQLRALTDEKYDVEVNAVLDDDSKSLNRVMHDAYKDDERTKNFDYDLLDRDALATSGLEGGSASTSEIQVIARFVADPSSLATITSPEDKEIICNYIMGTDIPDISNEEKTIAVNYILTGAVPEGYTEPQVQEIQQRVVQEVTQQAPAETDPATQKVNRVIGKEASLTAPDATQTVNRVIGQDVSTTVPSATQIVNREIHEQTIPSGGSGASNSSSAVRAAGPQKVNGTAHAEGTVKPSLWNRIKEKGKALLHGNWGLKKNETALVGELGQETVIRGSEFFTVGDEGAEFAKLRSGDVVLNHKQTIELFKNGYVTANGGRGRMIGGPAHVEGNYTSGALQFSGGASVLNNPQPVVQQAPKVEKQVEKQVEKAAEKAKKEEEKLFDWIEIRLDRITRKIEDLEKTASSAFHTFADRAKDYTAEYDKIIEKMDVTEQAIKKYQEEADKVGLDAAYVEKVKNGAIEIENIQDEELNEKITKYKEFYEKSLDLQYSLTDLKETLAEIQKAKFDLVATEFDKVIDKVQHTTDLYEKQIDLIEARGQFAGHSYYEKLIENEKKKAEELEKKYQALIKARQEAIASGRIAEGSEADEDMLQSIRDTELAWKDCEIAVEDYKQKVYEAEMQSFQFMQDQVSLLSEETKFLRDIMSVTEDDLFEKNVGTLNDRGKAVAALAASNLNILLRQAQQTKAMIDHVDAEIAADPTNKTLLENRAELIRSQRDLIRAANEEKKAIVDLIRSSYERMISNLDKLISKRKELLQSTKDYFYKIVRYASKERTVSLRIAGKYPKDTSSYSIRMRYA